MKRTPALITSLVSLAAVLLMVGGFLLPSIVSGIRDRQTLNKIDTIASETVNFDVQARLSLIEKITMNRYSYDGIYLETGRYLDIDSAIRRGLSELSYFLAPFQMDFNTASCTTESCEPVFILNSSDPSKNMIVWQLGITDSAGAFVSLTLDDESGKLLSLAYIENADAVYKNDSGVLPSPDIQAIAELLTEYWSLDIGYLESVDEKPVFASYTIALTDGTNITEVVLELYSGAIYMQ